MFYESDNYKFDMLKSFKISYKTVGENIAANSSNSGAVNSWMNLYARRMEKA